ncbi:MAG: Ig-like domain-containing protein [Ignavibacteria bacterium]|nr:Ig-like domain-containing protein [Ignavibacteria bacterium]
MQSVEAQNAALLRVKFSEEPVGVTAPQFTVTDSVSGAPHAVVAVLPSARGKYAWDVFLAPPLGRGRYLLRVDSLRDKAGHEIPEALRSVAFDGVDAADTVKPSLLSVSPAARATDVSLDSVFEVRFSHPMRAQVGATLRDSLRNALPLEASWASLTALRLAHPPLAPEAAYTLCIELASLRDSLRGMAVADTAFCVGFTTEKASSAGSISGAVTDRRGTALPKIVRAKNVEKKHLPVQTRAAADGAFSFPGLPAGRYMLDAWEDADSSGAWSPGKPFPFAPSERFAAAPDTVRVRARWETSGTRITLP